MFTITDEDQQLREEALAADGDYSYEKSPRDEPEAILTSNFEDILLEKATQLLEMYRGGETHTPERPLSIRVLVSQNALMKAMPRGAMTNENVRQLIHQYIDENVFKVALLHVDYYGDDHSLTLIGHRYTEFFLKLAA